MRRSFLICCPHLYNCVAQSIFTTGVHDRTHLFTIFLEQYTLKSNNHIKRPNLPPKQPDIGAMIDLTLLGTSPPGGAAAVPMLNPGELLRNSGKFTKPTKIPGKNYSKDEVVIRNADSGKGECAAVSGERVVQKYLLLCFRSWFTFYFLVGCSHVCADSIRSWSWCCFILYFSDGHQGSTCAHD